MDDVSDAEWFLAHNPPVYAMLGDFFGARKAPAETKQANPSDELRALAMLPGGSSSSAMAAEQRASVGSSGFVRLPEVVR